MEGSRVPVFCHGRIKDVANRRGEGAPAQAVSAEQIPIEAAVLDRFEEVQFLHRLLQHAAERGVDRELLADLRGGHAGVRARARARETRALEEAGGASMKQ